MLLVSLGWMTDDCCVCPGKGNTETVTSRYILLAAGGRPNNGGYPGAGCAKILFSSEPVRQWHLSSMNGKMIKMELRNLSGNMWQERLVCQKGA